MTVNRILAWAGAIAAFAMIGLVLTTPRSALPASDAGHGLLASATADAVVRVDRRDAAAVEPFGVGHFAVDRGPAVDRAAARTLVAH